MMHLYQQQQQQKQQNRLNMRHTLLLLILFAALIAAQQTEGGDNGTITAGSSTASFDSKEPIVKDDDFDSDSQSEQLKLQLQYGTEVSWPMQRFVSDDDSRSTTTQKWYTNYLQGCYETYSVEQCNENERDRIALNAAQPGRQKNFTFAGYAKVDAPREAFLLLQNFWNDHSKNRDSLMLEEWDEANIYTNHWEAPTSLLSLNPPSSANDEKGRRPKTTRPRPRLAEVHRRKIVAQVQSVLEQWTSVPLQPTSLYGIRSYTNGSILAPHVDRYVRPCYSS